MRGDPIKIGARPEAPPVILIPTMAKYPLARRRLFRPLPHTLEADLEIWNLAIQLIQALGVLLQVDMGVDQSRENTPLLKIHHLSRPTCHWFDFRIATHRDHRAALDRQRLHNRLLGIQRVDPPMEHDRRRG